jgi:hypothetical protein
MWSTTYIHIYKYGLWPISTFWIFAVVAQDRVPSFYNQTRTSRTWKNKRNVGNGVTKINTCWFIRTVFSLSKCVGISKRPQFFCLRLIDEIITDRFCSVSSRHPINVGSKHFPTHLTASSGVFMCFCYSTTWSHAGSEFFRLYIYTYFMLLLLCIHSFTFSDALAIDQLTYTCIYCNWETINSQKCHKNARTSTCETKTKIN